jgi:hypothetical protein
MILDSVYSDPHVPNRELVRDSGEPQHSILISFQLRILFVDWRIFVTIGAIPSQASSEFHIGVACE